MNLTETQTFKKSSLAKKLTSMKDAEYWKYQYESLVENIKPMEETIEQKQKRIQQLEEELETALSENGQFSSLSTTYGAYKSFVMKS